MASKNPRWAPRNLVFSISDRGDFPRIIEIALFLIFFRLLHIKKRLNNIIILQQDNAPPHNAEVVRAFMIDNAIQLLPWSAVSTDINDGENYWATVI